MNFLVDLEWNRIEQKRNKRERKKTNRFRLLSFGSLIRWSSWILVNQQHRREPSVDDWHLHICSFFIKRFSLQKESFFTSLDKNVEILFYRNINKPNINWQREKDLFIVDFSFSVWMNDDRRTSSDRSNWFPSSELFNGLIRKENFFFRTDVSIFLRLSIDQISVRSGSRYSSCNDYHIDSIDRC